MEHSFNIELARVFGVECAIILKNIDHWLTKNRENDKNFINGSYWTYNSRKAFEGIFPYMTGPQIKRRLHQLEDSGILITGSFNDNPFDKTNWYSINYDAYYEIIQKGVLNDSERWTNSSHREDGFVPCITDSKHIPFNKGIYTGSKKSKKEFVPPTLEEVEAFFKEKGFTARAAKLAFDYYDSGNWKDSRGTQVKNWKQKMIANWMREEYKDNGDKNGKQMSAFELMIPGN